MAERQEGSSDRLTEERLAAEAREVLDASVESLGPAVTERLAAARRAALEARDARIRARWWDVPWLMPAGALASVAATVAVIAVLAGAPPRATMTRAPMTGPPMTGPPLTAGATADPIADADLELLAEVEDLELLEDLDFYLWLGSDATAG